MRATAEIWFALLLALEPKPRGGGGEFGMVPVLSHEDSPHRRPGETAPRWASDTIPPASLRAARTRSVGGEPRWPACRLRGGNPESAIAVNRTAAILCDTVLLAAEAANERPAPMRASAIRGDTEKTRRFLQSVPGRPHGRWPHVNRTVLRAACQAALNALQLLQHDLLPQNLDAYRLRDHRPVSVVFVGRQRVGELFQERPRGHRMDQHPRDGRAVR